jgi:hypothetical protein
MWTKIHFFLKWKCIVFKERGKYVPLILVQLVRIMYNICNVWGSNSGHRTPQKKKRGKYNFFSIVFDNSGILQRWDWTLQINRSLGLIQNFQNKRNNGLLRLCIYQCDWKFNTMYFLSKNNCVLVDFKRKDFCFEDFNKKINLIKTEIIFFVDKQNDNSHRKLTHKQMEKLRFKPGYGVQHKKKLFIWQKKKSLSELNWLQRVWLIIIWFEFSWKTSHSHNSDVSNQGLRTYCTIKKIEITNLSKRSKRL